MIGNLSKDGKFQEIAALASAIQNSQWQEAAKLMGFPQAAPKPILRPI